MLKRFIFLFFCFSIVCCAPLPLLAKSSGVPKLREVSSAFREVAEKVLPSVVTIRTTYHNIPSLPKSDHPTFRRMVPRNFRPMHGSGSGVIFDDKGHIVTNSHVIDRASEIKVILNDGREIEAKLLGKDPKTDLAVLKIRAPGLVPAEKGDSKAARVGDWAIAIGNAMGFSQTMTVGIISAKGRYGLRSMKDEAFEYFIQTDAAINHGNSGGALCDIDGKVIGINSMIASSSGGSQGLGFAIPMKLVENVVSQMINKGKVSRPYLGILVSNRPPPLGKALPISDNIGVIVDDVQKNSPAEYVGIKGGDIITHVDGIEIKESNGLRNSLSQFAPGNKVIFRYIRKLKVYEAEVEMGSVEYVSKRYLEKIGIDIRKANSLELKKANLSDGIFIHFVHQGSPAQNQKISKDFIITHVDEMKVATPFQLLSQIDESLAENGKKIKLKIKSEQKELSVVLDLE